MRTIKEIESSAQRYFVRGQLEERERSRLQELRRPVHNDQRLLAPTLVRVLKVFCVEGKPVPIGSTVTLAYHDAVSLQALGKAELL